MRNLFKNKIEEYLTLEEFAEKFLGIKLTKEQIEIAEKGIYNSNKVIELALRDSTLTDLEITRVISSEFDNASFMNTGGQI